MTIENNDVLLVNRGTTSHKIKYETLKQDLLADQTPDAPEDGKQYGREDGAWTEIVHTPPYGDSDVNSLLKTPTAEAGQGLRWSGSEYYWTTPSEGGGGGDPGAISYTYPTGQNRTLQSRLEDYVSVKDFGAKGDGVTDDTVALRAAFNNGSNSDVFIPKGIYKFTENIEVTTGVNIFGSGADSVLLYSPPQDGDSGGGALKLQYNSGAYIENDAYGLSDFTLLADCGKFPFYGIQFEYVGPSAVVGAYNKLVINNLNIGNQNCGGDAYHGYFRNGLRILNAGGVVANNLNVYSNNMICEERDNTHAVRIQNLKDNHAMIRTFMCNNYYFQRYNTCLEATANSGSTIESIYLNNGEVLGYKGFRFSNGVGATCIMSTHFDCQNTAYGNFGTGGEHRVVACDLRNERLDKPSFDGYTMYLNADGCVVSNSAIRGYNAQRGCVEVGGTPKNIVVSNNVMAGGLRPNQLAINVGSGAEDVTFGGNSLSQFQSSTPWNNDPELYIYGQRTL